MNRPKSDPKLSHHKATGEFYVRIGGRVIYLGTDRPKAELERLRILLEWHRTGKSDPSSTERPAPLSLVFRWAVSAELVPASVYEAMKTVYGLKAGRGAATLMASRVSATSISFFGDLIG